VPTENGRSCFYDLVDKKLAPVLSRVQLKLILPADKREIQVNLDAVKMQAYGLSIPQVQQNILSSNLDFPGNIQTREQKNSFSWKIKC
jgi:HAE1 family hydrophobic/amphiphilic exporter-1